MEFTEILNMVFPIGFLLVIIALIWFIIELILMIRRARSTVDEVQKQIEPTLEHVEEITASLKPVAAKIDPLVERVSLTVDAANLEIMRIDQILEDVSGVTSSVSSAANAVDAAANAPLELVSNVTNRVRSAFKPRHASEESIALGQKKDAETVHEVDVEQERSKAEQAARNMQPLQDQKEADSREMFSSFEAAIREVSAREQTATTTPSVVEDPYETQNNPKPLTTDIPGSVASTIFGNTQSSEVSTTISAEPEESRYFTYGSSEAPIQSQMESGHSTIVPGVDISSIDSATSGYSQPLSQNIPGQEDNNHYPSK